MQLKKVFLGITLCAFLSFGCSDDDEFSAQNFQFVPLPNPGPGDLAPQPEQPLPPTSFVVPESGFLTPLPGTNHEIMILGLKANRTYSVDVNFDALSGEGPMVIESAVAPTNVPLAKILSITTNIASTPTVTVREGEPETNTVEQITTDPLPEDFPPIEVLVSQPNDMAPGVTMFNLRGRELYGDYLIIVNHWGEVLWYFGDYFIQDARRMSTGNLLICDSTEWVRELDMMGNEIRTVTRDDLGEPRLHHECSEMENGNLLTLGGDLRVIGPYEPDDEFFNVVGDTLVEFNWDGDVINWISAHDVLDPFRTLTGFHFNWWDSTFGMATKDWTHSNAIIHDPSDDTYIVSLRHQDAVVKFSRDGEMVWVLGEDSVVTSGDDDWPFLQMIGPGTYPNHQHAVELTPTGELILYDNANNTDTTRPVIFRIDEENLTMTQEWEYFDPERINDPICASFVGDADYLEGDHVLIGHMGASPNNGNCSVSLSYIIIVEVDRFTGEKLFEIEVRNLEDRSNGYRAERLPTLYP